MNPRVNQNAIDGLFNSNKAAKAVLIQLAAMPKQAETVIDEIESGLSEDINRRELVAVFRSLEEHGAGELIEGRKGHPSRFRWEVDILRIHGFQNKPALVQALPIKPITNPMIEHRFQLRPDLAITLNMPPDMTTTEANRLSRFISSLPFVDEEAS